MSILVAGGLLVTQDRSRRVLEGNLYVENGRIAEVAGPERSADVVLDARGCIVMPGLINCYTQTAHALLGPPRDTSMDVVRERMEALHRNLTRRDLQLAAALASAEMLVRGTTSFLDMFIWEEEVARAATQVGSRGFLSWLVREPEDLRAGERYLARVKSWDMVVPMVGSPGLAKPDVLVELEALAREFGTRWCLPLSETRRDVYRFQKSEGMRPVEWLERKDLLSANLIALHCVWLTMNEIRSMAKANAKVVHCPASNQMTGTGGSLALPEMLEEGVVLGLGTDSPALVGSLDSFHHMRLCALLHKGQRWDSSVAPAQLVLDLCTVTAAEVLGLDGGSLEEGKVADIVILDPERRASPPFDPEEVLSYLVYLFEGNQVRDVIVEGRQVVENGGLKALDLVALREDVDLLKRELDHEDPGH